MSLGTAATEDDAELISKLFGAIGKIWKADEKLFDAITDLSGPAYMFLAIEALADGGVAAGLPRDLALGLASQTRWTTSVKSPMSPAYSSAEDDIFSWVPKDKDELAALQLRLRKRFRVWKFAA